MARPPLGTIWVLPLERVGAFRAVDERCCDYPYQKSVVYDPFQRLYYAFEPSTDLQRDLWIRAGQGQQGRAERCAAIRKLCMACNVVWDPKLEATPERLAPLPPHVVDHSFGRPPMVGYLYG